MKDEVLITSLKSFLHNEKNKIKLAAEFQMWSKDSFTGFQDCLLTRVQRCAPHCFSMENKIHLYHCLILNEEFHLKINYCNSEDMKALKKL